MWMRVLISRVQSVRQIVHVISDVEKNIFSPFFKRDKGLDYILT